MRVYASIRPCVCEKKCATGAKKMIFGTEVTLNEGGEYKKVLVIVSSTEKGSQSG